MFSIPLPTTTRQVNPLARAEAHGFSWWAVVSFAGAALVLPAVSANAATTVSLTCGKASITGTASDSCTVTTSTPVVNPVGQSVSLSSNNSAVVVPSSVTIPSGASSAGFTAKASAVTTAHTVTLTARELAFSGTFQLKLTAYVPALTLGTTSVAFGDVSENTTVTQSVRLTSSGTAPLKVTSAAVRGKEFGDTGMSFPVTLKPKQSAELDVQFDPTAAGAASGTVTISSNAGSNAVIQLKGTGQAAAYQVDLSWDAPANSSDPVAGYKVYRAVSGSSSYQLLDTSVDSTNNYTDATVDSGTSYAYYVESVDAKGDASGPSNTYEVTIP